MDLRDALARLDPHILRHTHVTHDVDRQQLARALVVRAHFDHQSAPCPTAGAEI